ncbi:hypothetical protein J3T65_03985 [Staphylococcus simiae]|uniref:hypothetical protein n=1 Tax=Staphylococcus simiae TaxID=308354 RepID=UPI001A95817E|nr:hypothetical protein [Staphylococcus simiae]MBO1198633.1 hypothetical protein [Staphylococcus simiae]MBO1200882.1 hypothetical protein [Staphylococcus simiae]MBO1203090.1 hypothetical protein [Staphylococcus simiae]MBO1211761.1 hypothetical protein [Staphylococcus simiae]MBO1229218.1 hypothetical protein [Staphylococcus simiae]
MILDKFETYIVNIAGLNDRTTRKKLNKLCKSINFCDAFQFSIIKEAQQYVLEISLPKQQLPYFISFLSFHQYSIYQVLSPKNINELLDSNNLYQSAKRFDINIDGLQDAFIKDKVIDIMTMFQNHHDISYTLNKSHAHIISSPETFAKILHTIATRNIDILSATYKSSSLSKAHIS